MTTTKTPIDTHTAIASLQTMVAQLQTYSNLTEKVKHLRQIAVRSRRVLEQKWSLDVVKGIDCQVAPRRTTFGAKLKGTLTLEKPTDSYCRVLVRDLENFGRIVFESRVMKQGVAYPFEYQTTEKCQLMVVVKPMDGKDEPIELKLQATCTTPDNQITQ